MSIVIYITIYYNIPLLIFHTQLTYVGFDK